MWIDLYSRRIVGWKLDQRGDAALVIVALNRALGHRQLAPDQLMLHTDQGSQYRASDYRKLLRKHGIACSMSAKRCRWDNTVVESFFSTLKLELDLDDDREVLISSLWILDCWSRNRGKPTPMVGMFTGGTTSRWSQRSQKAQCQAGPHQFWYRDGDGLLADWEFALSSKLFSSVLNQGSSQ